MNILQYKSICNNRFDKYKDVYLFHLYLLFEGVGSWVQLEEGVLIHPSYVEVHSGDQVGLEHQINLGLVQYYQVLLSGYRDVV